MKKKPIKVIKREDGKTKPPPTNKVKPKKKRSIESTVQDWITERRDNEQTEDRSRNSEFNSWNADTTPAEASNS